jgi:hypothetical protein
MSAPFWNVFRVRSCEMLAKAAHSATCISIPALRAPAATGVDDVRLGRVGKVFLAMVTIFCLLLGAPFDADASSRFLSHAAV